MRARVARRVAAVAVLAVLAVAGGGISAAEGKTKPTLPAGARTWGPSSGTNALVLYDTTGPYGSLGQEYAMFAGNLATHFGSVTAEPVVDYVKGQVAAATAVIYIGSTYNEPIPSTFLTDVAASTKPIIWMYDNIWQLGSAVGETAFTQKYGWDPVQSYFAPDDVTTVTYKGQQLVRSPLLGGGIMGDDIVNPQQVSVLATANCETPPCSALSRSTNGTNFPWAIRSGNLTYIGELPFSYVSENDRTLAFDDLIFDALAPTTPTRHQAMVRIEDVNPTTDPTQLRDFAKYLHGLKVPFSVGVIPVYTDPNGVYNHKKAQTITLAQAPAVVSALQYMVSMGGTLIEHGYTHQYSNVANPYDGVTADDFEFYRSQCSTTAAPPYEFFAPCGDSGYVIEEGPVSGDSTSWAAGRVAAGRKDFTAAGLALPTIWETPHYAASAADYAGIDEYYSIRYERDLFFGGQLSGAAPDYSQSYGQFFPYVVHDIYGSEVLPENLGDYEPTEENDHPARLAADIVNSAKANLVVRDGYASFFIHPYDPISALKAIVTGIQGLGYTFVSPAQALK